MLWAGQAMRGYFQNLNYQVTQQRPYIITYDFTFIVTELITIPIVSTASNLLTMAKIPGLEVTRLEDMGFPMDRVTDNGTVSTNSQAEDFVKGGWGVKLF